jgi:hypothetical protein
MYKRTWALALVLSAGPPLAWGQVRLGSEFQVNTYTTGTYTTGYQFRSAVASDAAGNFVVVWSNYGQDGSNWGIFGQRFNASGVPQGSEFRVNSYTTGDQQYQAVASDANGNLIIVWESPQDNGTIGVFARRYDPAGNPLGSGEFRVNSFTTGPQQRPKVALGVNGSFVVVWHSNLQDGSNYGVFGRRYDSSGVPAGPDFQVNTYTTGNQYGPSVAADAAGNFVVAWAGQDGNQRGVFAQHYDTSGAPVGGEFQVNTYTTSSQYWPAIAMVPDGRFMVAWETDGQDGNLWGIAGRRYDALGVAQGGDFLVNTFPTGDQRKPAVTADATGNFIVTWNSPNQDGDSRGVFARRYDVSGSPDPPFLVNTYTTGPQSASAVSAASNGDFVVTWSSYGQNGTGYGTFAQRLSPDLIFRDGFESASLSAWSSSNTDGGDLSPSAFAAMNSSSVGLQAVVDDTAGIYVQDDSPRAENRYRARFYFDPNGFDPGEAQSHFRTRIFIGFDISGLRVVTLVLKRQTGAYTVEGRVRQDDGTRVDTGFFPITDGPHSLEFDWQRSTAPGANNGSFQLWIDGSSVATLSGIDNDGSPIEFVRMGAFSVKTGAAGTLYWDEFVSRRGSYIGP